MLIALAVGIAAIVLAGSSDEPSTPTAPGIRDLEAIFDQAVPLMPSGERVEGATAAARSEFPLYQPAIADGGEAQFWAQDGSEEVAIRYGDRLVLLYTPWPPGMDPATTLSGLTRSHGSGYDTSLAGQPARVVPAHDGSDVTVIQVGFPEVEVTLYGLMSEDELIAMADSLSAPG